MERQVNGRAKWRWSTVRRPGGSYLSYRQIQAKDLSPETLGHHLTNANRIAA